jgi:hypothetical protein
MKTNSKLSLLVSRGLASPLDEKGHSGFYIFKKWPSVEDYRNNKNLIFVFGSNIEGIHGAGAAKFAHEHLGAKIGIAEGFTGQTYALPTKSLTRNNIDVDQKFIVEKSIEHFLQSVLINMHSDQTYILSAIGTGLSELSADYIVNTLFKYISMMEESLREVIKQFVIFPSEFKEEMLERICPAS